MKSVKCPNCGANLKSEDLLNDSYVCAYCKTSIVAEDVATPTIINNYYHTSPVVEKNIPPRPRVSFFWAIILLWMYILPGLIYIAIVHNKQKDWDDEYINKK